MFLPFLFLNFDVMLVYHPLSFKNLILSLDTYLLTICNKFQEDIVIDSEISTQYIPDKTQTLK